jgi:DNA invertase Pin-like site-specific DNA recombinase
MKYVINDLIKNLTEARKEGKKLITESELVRLATPKINNIDEIISLIDKAIEKVKIEHNGYWHLFLNDVSFTEAARLTGISRQTLYRWARKDIFPNKGWVDLGELKKNMLEIKKIHELHE